MVIYFEGEISNPVLTHSGLVIENNPIRVRSKWGNHPDVFEHGLWCVPYEYGSLNPEYYTRPKLEDIEDFYYEEFISRRVAIA
ncbi:MAG TPA: hypothetical protein VGU44_01385 [Gammaproteobacteria bacterium]|nr:hypothetical protein [Gammaproteobacteria bacterium]